MHTIYCFIHQTWGTDVSVVALADDGTLLAGHVSSNEAWARKDIGLDGYAQGQPSPGSAKHTRYAAHCGEDGYRLEWVEDPAGHAGVKRAEAANTRMAREAGGTGVWVSTPEGEPRELTEEEL